MHFKITTNQCEYYNNKKSYYSEDISFVLVRLHIIFGKFWSNRFMLILFIVPWIFIVTIIDSADTSKAVPETNQWCRTV